MTHSRIGLAGLLVLLLLSGCAAVLVPKTFDPAEKLAWALDLIEHQDRPLPAENLIVESIDIYKTRQDERGLARAYRMYGMFYKSGAVVHWEKSFREYGFREKTANFENRLDKAIEYLDKSLELLQKNRDVSLIANVYVQMAFAYQLMGNKNAACNAYDQSLKSDQEVSKSNPELVTIVPKEFKSFEHGISVFKTRLGCKI